jgi:hypothetical protein
LRSIGWWLITTPSHKRRKYPHGVIVGFEQLAQALAEFSRVLLCRPVPGRISFSPGFAELEVYGHIDSRRGNIGNLLITRTTIRRIRFCIDVRSVLQRRCQELR